MDPDGSHVQPLTEQPSGTASDNAAFGARSPDRQKVAFNTTRDGNVEIYVMDADGGNVEQLTSGNRWWSHPDW